MRRATETVTADVAVARIAGRQHGVFTRRQAMTAGSSAGQLDRRRRAGVWERVEPRVYRLAGSPPTWQQQLFTAVLAAGTGATVSHRAAAGLWGLDGVAPGAVELSLPRGRSYDRVSFGRVERP